MESLHTDTSGFANAEPDCGLLRPCLAEHAADERVDEEPVDVYSDAAESLDDIASSQISDELSLHSAADNHERNSVSMDEERVAAHAKAERPQQEQDDAQFLQQQQEEVICRICFEGPGSKDDDGGDLGRLLKPCKCKGTMRYIHSGCLDAWRKHSRNSNSAVACDQCGAPYRFRSSRFVGLANSRALILLVSVLIFLVLVWFVGFFTLWMADRFDGWRNWPTFGLDWSELMYLDLDDDEYYTYRYAAPVMDDNDEAWSWDELGFFGRTMLRMALGSGVVGFMSALASMGLAVNPIGMGRFARGGIRERWLGGGARVGRGGRGKSDALAVTAFVVVIAVVLAGMTKALLSTYKLVRRMSRRMLAYAEDNIVDWYGDDEQAHDMSEPEMAPVLAAPQTRHVQDAPLDEAGHLNVEDDVIDHGPNRPFEQGLVTPATQI